MITVHKITKNGTATQTVNATMKTETLIIYDLTLHKISQSGVYVH